MKYIRFKRLGMVLFEETKSHQDFAELLQDEPISAGFVRTTSYIEEGRPVCSGDSYTLKIATLPEDTQLLRNRLNH
jgi:hypothetical protein